MLEDIHWARFMMILNSIMMIQMVRGTNVNYIHHHYYRILLYEYENILSRVSCLIWFDFLMVVERESIGCRDFSAENQWESVGSGGIRIR